LPLHHLHLSTEVIEFFQLDIVLLFNIVFRRNLGLRIWTRYVLLKQFIGRIGQRLAGTDIGVKSTRIVLLKDFEEVVRDLVQEVLVVKDRLDHHRVVADSGRL